MDFPDEEIEAEIQAELDKLNVEDLDLNSSAADSSEDDGITRVTEDVFTEQSSSDSEKKNNGDVQNSTLEVVCLLLVPLFSKRFAIRFQFH